MLQKTGSLKFSSGEGEVVLENELGKNYQVNTVMAFIWEKLDGKTSIRQIQEELSDLMSISENESIELIDFTVKELHKISLLKKPDEETFAS